MRTFSHDPDHRKYPPATGRHCCVCQRRLKDQQGVQVYVLDGCHELVAVEDVGVAIERGLFSNDWPADYVGPGCAKAIPPAFLDTRH